jgi:hypothetical protein
MTDKIFILGRGEKMGRHWKKGQLPNKLKVFSRKAHRPCRVNGPFHTPPK